MHYLNEVGGCSMLKKYCDEFWGDIYTCLGSSVKIQPTILRFCTVRIILFISTALNTGCGVSKYSFSTVKEEAISNAVPSKSDADPTIESAPHSLPNASSPPIVTTTTLRNLKPALGRLLEFKVRSMCPTSKFLKMSLPIWERTQTAGPYRCLAR